jgi:stage III sporulation protein AA
MALRVMTPDGLVCDEISTMEEAKALLQVHGCGIHILATAHAATIEDLYRRVALRTLLEAGVFAYVVLLQHGKVQTIRRMAAC